MSIQLRSALATDLDAIVALFRQCWTVSYAAVLEPSVLETMGEATATALWQRALRESAPDGALVAVDDGSVVGVTRFWVSADEPGYIGSLYVSPRSQGAGVGRMLLAEAERRLTLLGAASATLWVFSGNAPALAFYGAHGWQPDGGSRVQPQFGVPESRLSKALP